MYMPFPTFMCHSRKLPKSVEEFCRNVFNQGSLNGVSTICKHQTISHVTSVSNTMVIASTVTNRILDSWDALKLDFTNYQLEDKLRSAQNILDALNTPVFQNNSKKFFIMQKLNAVDISQILPTNPANFLPEKELYLGAKAEKMLSEIDESPEELKKLKTNVLAFYVELASQIRQRFDFANPLLYFLSNFDAETATSGKPPGKPKDLFSTFAMIILATLWTTLVICHGLVSVVSSLFVYIVDKKK
ncbi:hypothetical protein YQE_06410, partial [Dendroctonus ponderosae]